MLSVAGILNGLEAVGGLLRRSPSPAPAAAAATAAAGSPSGESTRASSLQELASRHDLRKITPEAFSNLARQLHQAGLIDDRELQDLAAVRLELDLAELPPDQPVNVLEFLETKLQRLQGQLSGEPRPAEPTRSATDYKEAADRTTRQLEFLREFQQARSGAGLDATI